MSHFYKIIKYFIINKFYISICYKFLNTDCYESLSNSVNINISHNYLSGPPYLFIKFQYKLNSFIFGYAIKEIDLELEFRKIDGNCENYLIFTSQGRDFKKLDFIIRVNLFNYWDIIANIEYNFTKGFKADIYELIDFDQNISLHIKVLDNTKKYIIKFNPSQIEKISYFKFLSKKHKNEMCIVTDNNNVIAIKPQYGRVRPVGLLTHFFAESKKGGRVIFSRLYPAYECDINNIYQNEPLVIIIDEPKFDVNFKAFYFNFVNEFMDVKIYSFKLYNTMHENINNLQNIPKMYKKLFLIKLHTETRKCPDNTERLIYISKNETIYFAIEHKNITILPSVQHVRNIYHSPSNPCEI